jgi:hypothetical protein
LQFLPDLKNKMSRISKVFEVRATLLPRLASAAFVIGVLSGCMMTEQRSDDVPREQTTPVDVQPVKPSPPLPPAKPRAQSPASPAVQTSPQFDPQELVGRGEAEVIDLLGAPSEIRDEPPARVWEYAGVGCSVNVTFYFDLTLRQFRALTYRVEPEGQPEQVQKSCLGGIQEGQRGRAKR